MHKIKIEGYKSIKNLELELNPINILIGANGSGKSNFLSFFELLKNIYSRNLKEFVALRGGIGRFLHKGEKITSEISARLWLNKNGYSFTLKGGEEFFVFTKEGLWYSGNPYINNPTDVASFTEESNLRFNTMPRAIFIRRYLDALQKYHFHDTGDKSPFNRESSVDNDKFYLYDKGQNLASYLFDIYKENNVVYNLIVKTIQSIAPYFLDFVFKPDKIGNIRLRWQSKHSDTIYGVNDLSDGTMRFVALVVLFMQPRLPETIIIDEPELGLHPSAIAKLSGMIKSVAAKGCQVILATQSTDLISHFDAEDIIAVDQINGQSEFTRLDSNVLGEWLENYTIDDLWKRNIIDKGHPNY